MGCCVSSGFQSGENGRLGPRSPPVEEEAVKEVLPETRIVSKVDDGGVKGASPAWQVEFAPPPPAAVVHNPPSSRKVVTQEKKVSVEEKKPSGDIVSESSEMVSCSESLSNAAAPAEKKKGVEEGGVVDQRPPERKSRTPTPTRSNGNGERLHNHSRKPGIASPERKTAIAHPWGGRGRTLSEERISGRDPGERSARRSRTPVRRTDSPARRNATDQKRVAVAPPPNDAVLAGEESLENPVVSLECFIFL